MSLWSVIKVAAGALVFGAVEARDRFREVRRDQQRRMRDLREQQQPERERRQRDGT